MIGPSLYRLFPAAMALVAFALSRCGGAEGPDDAGPPDGETPRDRYQRYNEICAGAGSWIGMTPGCFVAKYPGQIVKGSQFLAPEPNGLDFFNPTPEDLQKLAELLKTNDCQFLCGWQARPLSGMGPEISCSILLRTEPKGYIWSAAQEPPGQPEECDVKKPPYE